MTQEERMRIRNALLAQLNDLVDSWDKQHGVNRTMESRGYVRKHVHDLWSEMIMELPQYGDLSKKE